MIPSYVPVLLQQVKNGQEMVSYFGLDPSLPYIQFVEQARKKIAFTLIRTGETSMNREYERQVFPAYVFVHWNKTKTVYDFSETFLDVLSKSEPPVIYFDVLKRLPFPVFFVPFHRNEKSMGMFVYVGCDDDKREVIFGAVPVTILEDGASACGDISVLAHDGQSFTEVLGQFNKKDINPEAVEQFSPMLALALLCGYYLASSNAEVKERKISKSERVVVKAKNGKTRKVNIKTFAVGYRTGEKFEKQLQHDNPQSGIVFPNSQATSRRPHVRRAHWHHYWCGPHRERLEVRWLEPIFVMGDSATDIVTHAVSGAGGRMT